MGCLQSKEDVPAAGPGGVDKLWKSWGAMQALDGAKAAADKAAAPKPASDAGRAAKSQLDAAVMALEEGVKKEATSVEDVCRRIETCDYIRHLGIPDGPMRTFDGKWIKIDVPDNGHWLTAMDKESGSVRVTPAFKMAGVLINLSMAPMRSKVDSKGYTVMFTDHVKAVFAELPKRINNKIVFEWRMTEPAPYMLDGVEFYDWYQFQTVKAPTGGIRQKQWEIHGMRNREEKEQRKTHYYGYNISVVTPTEAVFVTMRPVLERIVQSIKYQDADVAEALMSKFWDKMGR